MTQCRPAQPHDAPTAAALVLASFDACVAPHYAPQGRHTFHDFANADQLAKRLRGESRGWLATGDAGTAVGFLEAIDRHICMLFVRPGYQRGGIGRQLLAAALAELGEGPLTVNASPNAVPAYERLGFVPLGPEREENGIVYVPMRRP